MPHQMLYWKSTYSPKACEQSSNKTPLKASHEKGCTWNLVQQVEVWTPWKVNFETPKCWCLNHGLDTLNLVKSQPPTRHQKSNSKGTTTHTALPSDNFTNSRSSTCLLCKAEPEIPGHVLLCWPELSQTRIPDLHHILNTCHNSHSSVDPNRLTNIILKCQLSLWI